MSCAGILAHHVRYVYDRKNGQYCWTLLMGGYAGGRLVVVGSFFLSSPLVVVSYGPMVPSRAEYCDVKVCCFLHAQQRLWPVLTVGVANRLSFFG